MRFLFLLLSTVLGGTLISAQSAGETARAAHLANAHYIIQKQDGIGRLLPTPASTEGGKVRFGIDEAVLGDIASAYLNYSGATATLEGDKFVSIVFDDGRKAKYLYEDGQLAGIGNFTVRAWDGDKPTLLVPAYVPNASLKKYDFARTIVEFDYTGDDLMEVRGFAEAAKAKSIDKIKKTVRIPNLHIKYTYRPADHAVDVSLKTYEIKKGTYVPLLNEPFRYTVSTSAPARIVNYKMANGKADITWNYDEKGRKKTEDAKYRFFGYVNNVTSYTYEGDQMLAVGQTVNVYQKGQRLSEIITDEFEVDDSNPEAHKRKYLGGEVHDPKGNLVGERRKGEARRKMPDGSWSSWRKSRQVGQ